MDNLLIPSNLKCSKHPESQIIFIQVNQMQCDKNIFHCEQCMLYDKKFHVFNCVQIKQILQNSNHSKLVNWPAVDDEILQDQIQNIQFQGNSYQLVLKIHEYFDNLKTEVFSKIEQCRKEMMRSASLIPQYEEQILEKLQECQIADQFKSILLNNKIEITEKENECRQLINKYHSQKHNYIQQLKQMFDNLNKKKQQIDVETPNQMKTQILEMIKRISFFKNENNQANNLINQINRASNNQQNNQLENKIQKIQKFDLLPKLYLSKSNYLLEYSENQFMKKIENNSIQITSQLYSCGNYYSNLILDRNKKYVFRFQIKTTKKEGESFKIGLVRDQNKHSILSISDKLSCQFYYNSQNNYYGHYSSCGIDKFIRGNLSDTKGIDMLELRVSIKDEILEVVDYPSCNHKYVLLDEYKNNLKTYQNLRLAIYLQNEIELTLINAYYL